MAKAETALRQEADIAREQLETLQSVTDPSLNALAGTELVSALLDRLRLALDAAEAGMLLLHPTTARGLFSVTAVPAEPIYEHERLTERESEVLRLLGEGLGNKEIAFRLAISEHTAKFHISSILGKLSVATRTEAVSQGIRRGLIPI